VVFSWENGCFFFQRIENIKNVMKKIKKIKKKVLNNNLKIKKRTLRSFVF
jgi:hypothetical protein